MARKTMSIKGEMVDFDLFEVKSQIAKKPQSTEAKQREQFVYSKRRRGSRRTVEKMMQDQQESAANAKQALDAQSAPQPASQPKPAVKKSKRRIIKKNKK